jgi:aspartate dehydrogenase
MKGKKVGIIGFGIIGRYLFDRLLQNGVEIAFVYDKQASDDIRIQDIFIDRAVQLGEQCAKGVDLVVETATAQAAKELAPIVLKRADMVVFSTTVFADMDFQKRAQALCREYQHNIFIPHGAILGLDGIFDGKEVLQSVSITTTKRPENLARQDKTRTVLYQGPTREACHLYPRNVNVHAGIALAGIGFDATQSTIIADPASPGNMHEIEIKAQGCQFRIQVLSDPISGVTGAYTPVSAYNSVRRILFREGIVVI